MSITKAITIPRGWFPSRASKKSEKPTSPTWKFHQFTLLPLELQRKIWRSLFPSSRTVFLSYNITPLQAHSCPPPITLSICSESRSETLLYYTLIYRSEFLGSRGRSGGNCGILLSKSMRQPICINPLIDTISFHAGDLCGENFKGRKRFVEWMAFLNSVDRRILGRVTMVQLEGLDWENTMYVHLKFQERLRCKEVAEEYEGQGGAESWEQLNYGGLLRLDGLQEIRCRYSHTEYMGNFEEQLRVFLGFHRQVWGGKIPVVKRVS
ncbi:uncharacterized protein EAF01_004599 [Botrytis porri]|uniref:2EXR domain-containing protein n=1 Tax=Botrytis porri TaxID=87229 RepID=A0A4Z1L137_9HELO|nr:uncharacterized protein EAF01_004599 [Botrytis porri]KAF7907012.1 hypothetical protein EAF01_004599 [Botrytis porri]TGO90529.1 hypothetical protein BPOR_0060g00020 [Botrytis porri]